MCTCVFNQEINTSHEEVGYGGGDVVGVKRLNFAKTTSTFEERNFAAQ